MKAMFNIMEKKMVFFGIAAVILVAGIASMLIQNLNLDIQFAGGVLITYDVGESFNQSEVEGIVGEVLGDIPFTVQGMGQTAFTIRFPYVDGVDAAEMRQALTIAIGAQFGEFEITDEDYIDPTVGRELARQTTWMAIVAVIIMLAYISVRFEFVTACVLVISLIFNVLIMITVYTLFQIPVNISFIAALLTVLAYTSNDTIVIFDRIRENMRNAKKESYSSVANRSIWQSITRSINTSVTTLVILILLLVMSVPSIREFAFPIIAGIAIGTFSSIFISAPLWAMWKDAGVKAK